MRARARSDSLAIEMSTSIQELGRLCRRSNQPIDELPYCLGSAQLIQYLQVGDDQQLHSLLHNHGKHLDCHMTLCKEDMWTSANVPNGMMDVVRRIRR